MFLSTSSWTIWIQWHLMFYIPNLSPLYIFQSCEFPIAFRKVGSSLFIFVRNVFNWTFTFDAVNNLTTFSLPSRLDSFLHTLPAREEKGKVWNELLTHFHPSSSLHSCLLPSPSTNLSNFGKFFSSSELRTSPLPPSFFLSLIFPSLYFERAIKNERRERWLQLHIKSLTFANINRKEQSSRKVWYKPMKWWNDKEVKTCTVMNVIIVRWLVINDGRKVTDEEKVINYDSITTRLDKWMMQVNLKFVLCIIYIIMILGAIISLPFLVMVVGNKVNSYHRTQALEMVSKREATGVSKARFTPPKIDNNSHESQHGHNQHRHRHRHHLNHHEQHQHDQQDQQELHQQSSHSSISPLSPSLPALELTFTNTDQQQSPSSLQSVASFESSDTLHRLSPSSSQSISASTTSLHHHTKRKRRKKKRIRDEIQVDEQPPLETQTDTNLIELNTYFNSSPAPSSTLSPPSALILNSFPLPKRDYLYDSKNDDNGRRTSSKLHDNLNIEESSNNKNTFTAKYYYLYNRCSGHKVQILGMKKVSAAPLTTSSGQSQLSPSTSFHRSNRHHHSLMYLLHHQEQLPVSFSTTGDLLDDDYGM